MGFTISIVIFVFIAWGFLKILGETIINLIKLINAKSPQELKKTRHLLFIKGGFLLPWELINLTFTFVFAFIIFHWFTSSIFIIALTSFLFKEIFSEIPYLLLSAFYYLLKKPISLKEDPFMQKTEIIPVNFFSCLYIPQKAKSISDVYAGITQGLRALRNNLQPKSHLVFIYHSDSEEDRLIEEEIRLILEAKKEFGEKIFIFARNREAYNPFFLRKPGGYISDYQILNTGIWHPLNYVGHNFDARRQKVVSLEGVMRDHIPFYSSGEKKENQYFLLYRRNLFLKEKMNLRRIKEDRELFENIEFSSQGYLINKDRPEEYYLLSQGAIFSHQGKLLLKPHQWKMGIDQKILTDAPLNGIFKDKHFTFVFVQIVYLNGEKKLFLDPLANLREIETGKIWAEYGKYKIEFSYDLYKLKDNKFILLKKDFPVKGNFFKERDYRRLIFDRMTKISWESLRNLVQEKIVSFSQAEEFMQSGIVGNPYHLHIGKKGTEKEYFVEDPLIGYKLRVWGGYLVEENRGFRQDEKGNLIFENRIVEDRESLQETFVKNEDGIGYLMYKERGEEFFVRSIETNERIRIKDKEKYFYVLNPWFNKVKFLDSGFVVNEKDGFLLDEEGNLWYRGEEKPLCVAKKDKIEELSKEIILIDYKDHALKRITPLAECGGWYRDERNKIRIRKIISLRESVYFDEELNACVINPLKGELVIYPLGSYTLGEVYLWLKNSPEDIVVEEENISTRDGDLIKEEVIAQEGEYRFHPEGEVILNNGERIPYGIYLRFKKGEILRDKNGNFIPPDCGIKIINQTDADGEFQPQTIPYLNSKLIYNLKEDEPFLMLQPEISFGNQGESNFARFHYWGQQMYRFTGRTIFSVYGESSAYGKMTKWLDAYVKNIVFKEAIPPLARTHDHWEAMHLKTGLVISYPHLKSKNLIENTPPNYFSFLKRLEGWLGGDMLLLEYETYFGVFLDFLRIIFSFLSMNISEGKYWINHLSKRMNYLREKSDTPSHLSKKLRIWLIKRLSFSPFYYGLWLFLVGTVSLIIPGTLTIRAPQLAWCIFWSVLFILICLPKLIIPLLERLLLFERRKTKLFIFILTVLFSFLINKWGREILPDWNKICLYLLGIYLAFPLIFHALGIIFTFKPGMTRRLGNFLILLILGFYLWLYMPFLINWLANIPSARWIFSFSLQFIPSALGFLLPFLFLSKIIPSPRISLELIKRGLLETIYSSSILLLNIIHIPLIVFSKMYFIIFNPHKTIPWITSPFIEKILGKRISLFDTYLRLIWAPLFSFSLTLLPVALGWADPSLLFYGWPIFIWSWILGPLLVWYSGNYGESQTFSSLTFLGIRDIISLHKKEFLNQNLSCNQAKLIEIILEYNLKLNHSLSQRELLRLFLYFITDIKYEESSLKKLRERYLPAEISPENLREYNWETLNELGRARIFRKVYRNSLPRETKIIQVISVLVNLMGPKRWGLPAWEELPSSQQEKLLRKIFKRYVVSYEEERAIKKLLQLFGKKELKRLSLKIKKIKELKEIISLIPAEFFYLRKAIKDMENLSSLHLNPFQKKIFLNLLITRYNLKEKNQVSIINHILNLLPSSPSAKERQK